jgi:A/G-specific adenine glycosylase
MHLFSKRIIDWYLLNKRNLPWRNTKDPYKIWLSEIILQQTRVAQGLDYYKAFAKKYPTVHSLARAPEQDVLKLWQGLGYYSRARNLHAAAKQIMKEHKGRFPREHDEILKLKGVGTYTAAAIASFAFNKAHAVVDGNVYRVLSRIFGIDTPIDSGKGRERFAELAHALLDKKKPQDHNQAIMEFGAIQCVPVNPDCDSCIFVNDCVAFLSKKVGEYPVKSKKTKQVNRYFNYLVIEKKGNTFIEKRKGAGIWQNLYQFPLIESEGPLDRTLLLAHSGWKKHFAGRKDAKIKGKYREFKHVLSHQVLFTRFWNIELKDTLSGFIEISRLDIENYPVPRLIDRFLNK